MPRSLTLLAFLLLALASALHGAAGAVRVTILQTTDLHDHARGAGQMSAAAPALGGYPRIAAYVARVRAECGHPVLLVDSGDWSMGTLYDLTLGRRPLALRFADALGYDGIALGNHEFDHGPAGLARILLAANPRTPVLASNLEAGGDPDLAPFLGPGRAIRRSLVKTLANGVRVGILGFMGRAAAADAAAPVRFADYSRDYALVQDQVDQLRALGCRLVLALDHAGTDAAGAEGEDVDLARNVTGIDVIASGHAHNPLDSARTVANGAWRTLIICAGAYGTNVSRLDLVFPPGAAGPRVEASANPAMDGPATDPGWERILAGTDLDLNRALASVFTQVVRFPDYAPDDPARGIYRPVAQCAQDLSGNGRDALPGPNGLGDLCADAMRAVANGLAAGDRADPTPFTVAALATGELRGALAAGAPVTFADVYGLLPLGLSPDPAQAGSTGEPLVSGYLDPDGLRALCAMQLLAQAGLAGPDDYLNLSGLSYGLKPPETAALFACASAVTALRLTRQRAGEGSALAGQALAALVGLASDQGGALVEAAGAGNPYAGAMVRLADPVLGAANLALLGEVAAAADRDAASGATGLEQLLMVRALAAIGPVAAFAPADLACTGPASVLGPGRRRVVLDLYLLSMMGRVERRFGLGAAVYRDARGEARLDGDVRAMLGNRLDLDPGGPFREVKAWMAPLLFLDGGRITSEYRSGAGPGQFQLAGWAVRARNQAYPSGPLSALADLALALRQAP